MNLDTKSIIDESYKDILDSLDNIVQDLDKKFSDVQDKGKEEKAKNGYYQWLIMVYMDGDNNLESAAINDFLEMAQVGSTAEVGIVVLLDRIDGNDNRYDDWTGCARFKIEQYDTPILENACPWYALGEKASPYEQELDMADTQTLVEFVQWARSNYSASNYALVLWNHGGGWRERIEELKKELEIKGETLSLEEKKNILSEISKLEQELQEGEAWKAVCWDDTTGPDAALYTAEVREALETLYNWEINIDLIGFDACLMGMLEVAHEIKDYGTVMVASEKTEPGEGWPYDDILEALASDAQMSDTELGSMIVEKYGASYAGDNTLSAVLLREQPRPLVDGLAGIAVLSQAVSDFADTVIAQNEDWDVIFDAQLQAGYYSYTSYRDLKGFIEPIIAHATNEQIRTAAQAVKDAFDECIIKNHSSLADKGNGLSIYFPLWYWEEVDSDYNDTNLLFAYETSWDEFLHEYVDAYLIPSHTGEATLSRSIPGGTTASAYVMISSPVHSGADDPVADLQDDLGTYDNTMWRLFRWNTEIEDYDEYPYTEHFGEEEDLEQRAYWLISRDTVDIVITGNLQQETNSPDFIVLYPGWNQIGTPFNFEIGWDTVHVTDDEEELGCGVTSSENDFLTSQTLWKYADGNYSASAVMEPGKGYWIKNITNPPQDVYLVVLPIRSTLSEVYMDLLERSLTAFAKSTEETPPAPPGGIEPEPEDEGSNNNSGSRSSQCFIATACFGSPMAGEVEVLRNFRNEYLLKNPFGKVFVSFYYRYSPPIARLIENHSFLKVMVRSSLYPIVKGCKLTLED